MRRGMGGRVVLWYPPRVNSARAVPRMSRRVSAFSRSRRASEGVAERASAAAFAFLMVSANLTALGGNVKRPGGGALSCRPVTRHTMVQSTVSPPFSLHGHRALVTGGTRGIGAAVARLQIGRAH